MTIDHVRFHLTAKNNYKQMKSSMTQSDTEGDDYNSCEILPKKNRDRLCGLSKSIRSDITTYRTNLTWSGTFSS